MSNSTTHTPSGMIAEPKRRSALATFFIRLIKEKPLGTVGLVIVVILFLTGIFADLAWLGLPDIGLAPYGMNDTNMKETLSSPSTTYLLGTDNLGRDLLSRVIYGARISMIVGLFGTLIAIGLSVSIGVPTGYLGGKLDIVVQRFVDAWLCFPGLVLLILLMSIVGPGTFNIIAILGLRYGLGMSRIIRGSVISVRENVYVEAAVAIGCPTSRILWRHILPNIIAPVIVLFTTRMPIIILQEANLSFLGFGIPPPAPSWGGMLSGVGRSFMYLAPWLVIWPGIALASVVYGINMFGDAMRDLLDPRLRGGVGRYGVKLPKSTTKSKSESTTSKGA